jgi:hypothetical protein
MGSLLIRTFGDVRGDHCYLGKNPQADIDRPWIFTLAHLGEMLSCTRVIQLESTINVHILYVYDLPCKL